jgi:serine protease Do
MIAVVRPVVMSIRLRFIAPFVTAATILAGAAGSASAQQHPPLPPLPGPFAQPPQNTAHGPAAASNPVERAKRGVVTVEREGRVLGMGAVLSGDGRILTALSSLGNVDTADVRYADGSSVHARVGHRDKSWDLALLVPLTGKWTDGLAASETDPAGAELRAFASAGRGQTAVVPASLKGKIDARAKEGGDALPSVLELDARGTPPALGSPIIDASGSVVGILVRACKGFDGAPPAPPPGGLSAPGGQPASVQAPPCTPLVVGAPIPSIRQFLSRTPLNAVAPSPWLGIRGEADASGNVHGVRILAVAPGSPASTAGLKTGPERGASDLIVAVDGQPIDSPEKLAELISKHAVGDSVKLLVLTSDKFRDQTVVLRAAP